MRGDPFRCEDVSIIPDLARIYSPFAQQGLHVELAKRAEHQKRILDKELSRRQLPNRSVRFILIRVQRLRLDKVAI